MNLDTMLKGLADLSSLYRENGADGATHTHTHTHRPRTSCTTEDTKLCPLPQIKLHCRDDAQNVCNLGDTF